MPKPDPARTLATMAAFPEHVDIEVLIFWQDLAHRQTAPPAASSGDGAAISRRLGQVEGSSWDPEAGVLTVRLRS